MSPLEKIGAAIWDGIQAAAENLFYKIRDHFFDPVKMREEMERDLKEIKEGLKKKGEKK